ncbi:RDD family protein [Candidatus Bathyarchaeota archaeon]|nr:RDD family protein [Candidatus Bathyarchaeota archaeon]
MVYCKKCGKELAEDADYCPSCGAVQRLSELELATWGERFLAWIIDAILVGIVVGMFTWPLHMWSWTHPVPFLDLGIKNVFLFLYWAYLEGTQGQSLGKRALRIKVVDLNGEPIDMSRSLYQAIGKAFLGPLDVIIGWLLYQEKQQRLFNFLSGTIVVKE